MTIKSKLPSRSIVGVILLVLCNSLISAQLASGGEFSISQIVQPTSGGDLSSGQFRLSSTIGQVIAGQRASNQGFAVHAGFWIPADLLPTAAHLSVLGQVRDERGVGIRNVRITMASQDGENRQAFTNPFGNFIFDNVEVGRTYIFTASSGKYSFQQPSIVRSILDDAEDVVFIASRN